LPIALRQNIENGIRKAKGPNILIFRGVYDKVIHRKSLKKHTNGMKKEDFTIALSERDGEEAIKEVSLKLKSVFPKNINYLLLLFTPHYSPPNIIEGVHLTLKPKKIIGLSCPCLIFEDKIIDKGVIACCINKQGVASKEVLLKSEQTQEIETLLRLSFQKPHHEGYFLLSLLAPRLNPNIYLNAVRLSLGKAFPLFGIGYAGQQTWHVYQIIGDTVNDGSASVALEGLNIQTTKIEGYTPLGKPFVITKAIPEKGIIMEINDQPAVRLYRHYLQEKFDAFMKNSLFSLYPLGIKSEGHFGLVHVMNFLDDGSLMCIGEIKENVSGHLMLLDASLATDSLYNKLSLFEYAQEGLVFIINTLARKKILKNSAHDEIAMIRQMLHKDFQIMGVFCDYTLSPDRERAAIAMDANNILLTLWQ